MFVAIRITMLMPNQKSGHYTRNYERILMKFDEGVQDGTRYKYLDFGSDLDHHVDCPFGNPVITQYILNKFS